jgi:VanZ family protein
MHLERRRTYIRWAFFICLAVVLALSLMPPEPLPTTGWDKANHALAFAVLAMLGCRSYPGRQVSVLLGLLAYGVLIEFLQSLTGYRTAELLDVVADGVGLVIGWPLARFSLRTRRVP